MKNVGFFLYLISNNNSSNSATVMALLDLQFSLLFVDLFYASIPENVNQSNYFSTGRLNVSDEMQQKRKTSLISMSVPLCVCLFPTL